MFYIGFSIFVFSGCSQLVVVIANFLSLLHFLACYDSADYEIFKEIDVLDCNLSNISPTGCKIH